MSVADVATVTAVFFLNSALLAVFTIIVVIFRKSFVFRIDPSYY